jgi:hypothetical protein
LSNRVDSYVGYLQDVLITIHENIRDLRQRKTFAEAEELTYIEAKLVAYQEVLETLRMSAREYGIDHTEIGL